MFVRWQFKELVRGNGGTRYTAVLVSSYREPGNPNPKHKSVYLGSIEESCLKHPLHRALFWDHVDDALDARSIPDREKIERSISQRVPRLSLKDYRAVAAERARILGWRHIGKRQQAAVPELEGNLSEAASRAHAATGRLHDGARAVACSFCGCGADQAEVMFSGQAGVYICSDCIRSGFEKLRAHRARNQT